MERQGIQINKFVSSSGYCSRREADRLVEQGRVMINDKVAKITQLVKETDSVSVDFEYIKKAKVKPVYMILNKPAGITCTTDLQDRSNIISFLKYPKRIFPIGRLDKDSEGLIMLTNDGDIVNKILRAENHHEKEYLVIVNKSISPEFIQKMSSGIEILGTKTLPCKVKMLSSKKFTIILQQGLNRQIRRMCEALGYDVMALTRVRIMNVQLGNLAIGKWRYLNEKEIMEMEKLLQYSTKTK
ncbi:MAG: pseudouridine synthase [Bacteroidetes bacterium]|nr:pseudouridine synthase [Bacteroidota bacterium]